MAKKMIMRLCSPSARTGAIRAATPTTAGGTSYTTTTPEKLWHKLNDPKEEKVITFKDIAKLWKEKKWDTYTDGTKASYSACYDRAIQEYGDIPILEIHPHDIKTSLERMRDKNFSAVR